MPRNVEVKARIDGDFAELFARLQSLADQPARGFEQCDTFFPCPASAGRLKLRVEENRPAELIYYERNESSASTDVPKLSTYSIAPVSHPDELLWGFYDPQMSSSIDGTDLLPHDRAVLRAYRSKYRPPPRPSSYFIGHVPPTCTEPELKELFPRATSLELIRDLVTRESKGYAFADGWIDRQKEYRWKGHLLFVEEVASKKLVGWKPRRCGGGLGGEKQSGQLRFGGSQRPFKRPFEHKLTAEKVLSLSLGGIRGEVKKHRTLFVAGQTRIHLDRVDGLSPSIFVELEVALRDEQTPEEGQRIADELCQRIGIEGKDHLHCAYLDLLLSAKEK